MLETTIWAEGMGTPLPYVDNVAMEFSTQTIAECPKLTLKVFAFFGEHQYLDTGMAHPVEYDCNVQIPPCVTSQP